MKGLTKDPEPAVLQLKAEEWTAEYVAATSSEDRRKKERWRHAGIKSSLKAETNSKCAYCEAFVDDVAFPHVEHIKPKIKFPHLAHEWLNMTTACERCNIAKDDYWDSELELLNPYIDDLHSQLKVDGSFLDWVAGESRAEITVTKLRLNRQDLVLSRTNRLMSVRGMVERWHESPEPLRSVLAEAIRLDAEQGEFTQTVITHLRSHNFPI